MRLHSTSFMACVCWLWMLMLFSCVTGLYVEMVFNIQMTYSDRLLGLVLLTQMQMQARLGFFPEGSSTLFIWFCTKIILTLKDHNEQRWVCSLGSPFLCMTLKMTIISTIRSTVSWISHIMHLQSQNLKCFGSSSFLKTHATYVTLDLMHYDKI